MLKHGDFDGGDPLICPYLPILRIGRYIVGVNWRGAAISAAVMLITPGREGFFFFGMEAK